MTLSGRLLLVLALCSAFALAQSNGEIRVEVRDPSGAGMAATTHLRSLSGKFDRTLDSNAAGLAVFSGLPYGQYRLEVSRAGFATQSTVVDVSAATVTRAFTLALATQTSRINVVSPTPLPGTDLAIDQIAAPVQTVSAADLQSSNALDLADLLNRRLDGVHINENQENPFQPDVNFRGYTASPLLGTPIGISVYLDGVRQNQPFGDIVAWDLIPKIAIAEVALMPGSNPLFGLNTLGGALSVQTKDGYSQPGGSVSINGGSFGRREGEIEYGGSTANGFSYYGAGNLFREDGWRQFSPSEVRQAFGKLGWKRGKFSTSLAVSYADNWLTGNGLQDSRFLAQNYSSVYSIPDITWNRSPSFNLSTRYNASNSLTFSGNAYFRYIRADTTNGDINSESFDESLYNLSAADIAALTAAGYKGFPTTGNATTEPFPYWRCIAQGLEKSEPIEKCTGIITNTFDKQHNYGLSGQAAWAKSHHHVTFGTAWDRSDLGFQQRSQFGYLNPDRLTVTPINAYADGSTNQDGTPVDSRVELHGITNTFSLFATDTLTFGKLALTISGRYNHTGIQNIDRLPPATVAGSRGSLNGQSDYQRFNPAIGLTYGLEKYASVYASYSEASRAPTSIELGCADANDPCNLPNALVSDPPLKQVVARTVEAGIRSAGEGALRWNIGWFFAENHNDLLFVASQQTGFGYFTNFGQTRRDGVDISVSGKIRRVMLGGNYTRLSATYQSQQTVDGGSNSFSDGGLGMDGNITVNPGDRIPQIPRNLLKAYAEINVTSKLSVDVDFHAVGRSFARGNENNLDKPDGVYYLGQGFSPGYGVTNIGAHYQLAKRVRFFVQVNNVFNHRYYTGAQLGPTPFDNSGNFIPRPFPSVGGDFPIRTTTFFAPGAPIGANGGMKITF